MCHDIFINLANVLNVLQPGTFTKSTEVRLEGFCIFIPDGARTFGFTIVTAEGAPKYKVERFELLFVNATPIFVFLISKVSRLEQLEKSMLPVILVHPFKYNEIKLGIVGNTLEFIISDVATFVHPFKFILFMLVKCINNGSPFSSLIVETELDY